MEVKNIILVITNSFLRSLGREDITERIPSLSLAPVLPSLAMLQVNTTVVLQGQCHEIFC